MGQYYIVFNLDRNERYRITHGCKMMEHAYLYNYKVNNIEFLLLPGEKWYKQRIVWAGDYAPKEENQDYNLYEHPRATDIDCISKDDRQPRYIINHDRKLYIDKQHFIDDHKNEKDPIHPLVLLTAEGCGEGMGDYCGSNPDKLIGSWARNRISTNFAKPSDSYSELRVVLTNKLFTYA